ncbi:hypothetical protein ACWEEL_09315, partial [Streptomyces sp. NPDC005009]
MLPGLLPGTDACTVKVNTKFPGAVPSLRGAICLRAAARRHRGVDTGRVVEAEDAVQETWLRYDAST